MTDLDKPCAECGGPGVVVGYPNYIWYIVPSYYQCHCRDCLLATPKRRKKKLAIEYWNRMVKQ